VVVTHFDAAVVFEPKKHALDSVSISILALAAYLSTPEEKCIGFPEQKYISEAGKKGP
jgi:hypothetical protein